MRVLVYDVGIAPLTRCQAPKRKIPQIRGNRSASTNSPSDEGRQNSASQQQSSSGCQYESVTRFQEQVRYGVDIPDTHLIDSRRVLWGIAEHLCELDLFRCLPIFTVDDDRRPEALESALRRKKHSP